MSGFKVGALFGFLLLSSTLAFAEVHVNVYVPTRPPAIVVESRPAAHATGHVWVPGYHRWDGGSYVWVNGRWDQPPNGHHRWAAGQWRHNTQHGWYWTDGRWR